MKNTAFELRFQNVADPEYASYGQRLIVDRRFARVLNKFRLTVEEIKPIADAVCIWLTLQNWFIPERGILFAVDAVPNPSGFSLGCAAFESDVPSGATVMIVAHTPILQKQIKNIQKSVRLENLERRQHFLDIMLRGRMKMDLAHELSHAFGINRRNIQFSKLCLPDLEDLTDSCAFLSCEQLIGQGADLALPYLRKRLKLEGAPATLETIRKLATRICCDAKKMIDGVSVSGQR